MIKLGIELPDKSVYGIDMTNIKDGNPGVGGSEYLFALLGTYLKDEANNIDICIYHYSDNDLSEKNKIITDEFSMLQQMEEDNIDVFIYQVNKSPEWYKALRETGLKAMAWAHIYLAYYEQREMIATDNIKRVVFVGKEEYDAYIDSDLIDKSTYIYNMLNTKKEARERVVSDKEVTYVGSLVPAKGFHVLAKVWDKVLEKVPDAKLNVIGTGRVYDRNAKLGKYGIAQDDYEQLFMKYLTTSDGSINPSVCFLGLLGDEKEEVFYRTMVGVVNPTAITETFCMSAVEMELVGVPVVSRKKWGLLDTVINNKTGFLFRSESEFVDDIVTLLNDKKLNFQMGDDARAFVKNSFEASAIVKRWKEEIEAVYLGEIPEYLPVQGNLLNDNKWIKQCIRFIRFTLHIKIFPDYEKIKNFLRGAKNKFGN